MSTSDVGRTALDQALASLGALAAAELSNGMRVGLGTGRAAEAFIRAVGARLKEGLSVVGVPTSERSAALAREVGIEITELSASVGLDVAVDGADEVTPDGSLTKGLGGAMLRERVVARDARRFFVLVGEEKLVTHLGERSPLPIEVVPFALATATRALRALDVGEPRLRTREGVTVLTDNGNVVVDLHASGGRFADPRALDRAVRAIPGVVDDGFFLDMSLEVFIGRADGGVERRPPSR